MQGILEKAVTDTSNKESRVEEPTMVYGKAKYCAFDVAREILHLAQKENIPIDPLKLIKLTYIAHGAYMAVTGRPLVEETVQAWKLGPVFPNLYFEVRSYSSSSIPGNALDPLSREIDEEDKEIIHQIWSIYKDVDSWSLSESTHIPGSPWSQVYEKNVKSIPIENDRIQKYYKSLLGVE